MKNHSNLIKGLKLGDLEEVPSTVVQVLKHLDEAYVDKYRSWVNMVVNIFRDRMKRALRP